MSKQKNSISDRECRRLLTMLFLTPLQTTYSQTICLSSFRTHTWVMWEPSRAEWTAPRRGLPTLKATISDIAESTATRVLGKHISLGVCSQNCPSAWAVLVSQSGFLDTLHRAWQNNYEGAFQFKQHNFAFSLHLPTMFTHGSGYLPRRTLTTASSLSLQHIFNSFAILLKFSWVNKQKTSVNTNQLLLEEADTWP